MKLIKNHFKLVVYFFVILAKIKMIIAKMAMTMKMPTPIPRLKIPSTTSQLVKLTNIKRKRLVLKMYLFIIFYVFRFIILIVYFKSSIIETKFAPLFFIIFKYSCLSFSLRLGSSSKSLKPTIAFRYSFFKFLKLGA